MQENEIEKRSLVDEDKYVSICAFLLRSHSHEAFKEITNIYLDDNEKTLEKNNLTLRIRIDEKTISLTLKEVLNDNQSIEHTQEITQDEIDMLNKTYTLPEGEVLDYLKEKELDNLLFINVGEIKTRRLEIPSEEGDIKIVLDKNEYNEKIDYDIEVEAPTLEVAEKALRYFSQKFHFKISKNYISKHDRVTS